MRPNVLPLFVLCAVILVESRAQEQESSGDGYYSGNGKSENAEDEGSGSKAPDVAKIVDVMKKLNKTKSNEELSRHIKKGARQVMHSIVEKLVSHMGEKVSNHVGKIIDAGAQRKNTLPADAKEEPTHKKPKVDELNDAPSITEPQLKEGKLSEKEANEATHKVPSSTDVNNDTSIRKTEEYKEDENLLKDKDVNQGDDKEKPASEKGGSNMKENENQEATGQNPQLNDSSNDKPAKEPQAGGKLVNETEPFENTHSSPKTDDNDELKLREADSPMYADGSKGEESTHKDPENDDLSEAPSVKKPMSTSGTGKSAVPNEKDALTETGDNGTSTYTPPDTNIQGEEHIDNEKNITKFVERSNSTSNSLVNNGKWETSQRSTSYSNSPSNEDKSIEFTDSSSNEQLGSSSYPSGIDNSKDSSKVIEKGNVKSNEQVSSEKSSPIGSTKNNQKNSDTDNNVSSSSKDNSELVSDKQESSDKGKSVSSSLKENSYLDSGNHENSDKNNAVSDLNKDHSDLKSENLKVLEGKVQVSGAKVQEVSSKAPQEQTPETVTANTGKSRPNSRHKIHKPDKVKATKRQYKLHSHSSKHKNHHDKHKHNHGKKSSKGKKEHHGGKQKSQHRERRNKSSSKLNIDYPKYTFYSAPLSNEMENVLSARAQTPIITAAHVGSQGKNAKPQYAYTESSVPESYSGEGSAIGNAEYPSNIGLRNNFYGQFPNRRYYYTNGYLPSRQVQGQYLRQYSRTQPLVARKKSKLHHVKLDKKHKQTDKKNQQKYSYPQKTAGSQVQNNPSSRTAVSNSPTKRPLTQPGAKKFELYGRLERIAHDNNTEESSAPVVTLDPLSNSYQTHPEENSDASPHPLPLVFLPTNTRNEESSGEPTVDPNHLNKQEQVSSIHPQVASSGITPNVPNGLDSNTESENGSKSEKQVTEVINTPLHGSTFETELRSIESRTTVLEAAVAEVLERLRNIEGEIENHPITGLPHPSPPIMVPSRPPLAHKPSALPTLTSSEITDEGRPVAPELSAVPLAPTMPLSLRPNPQTPGHHILKQLFIPLPPPHSAAENAIEHGVPVPGLPYPLNFIVSKILSKMARARDQKGPYGSYDATQQEVPTHPHTVSPVPDGYNPPIEHDIDRLEKEIGWQPYHGRHRFKHPVVRQHPSVVQHEEIQRNPLMNLVFSQPEKDEPVPGTCSPVCENGGACMGENICKCPNFFGGPQCQFYKLPVRFHPTKRVQLEEGDIEDANEEQSSIIERPMHTYTHYFFSPRRIKARRERRRLVSFLQNLVRRLAAGGDENAESMDDSLLSGRHGLENRRGSVNGELYSGRR